MSRYTPYLLALLYSSSVSLAAPARLYFSQTLTSTSPESMTTLANPLVVRSDFPFPPMFWQYPENILDSDDSESVNLPPVSAVFMSMAAKELAALSTPASTSTFHTTFLSTSPSLQSIPAPTKTPKWGPGLAIPSIPSSTQRIAPSTQDNQINPAVSTHKLAIIGSVVGGLTAITLCIVLFASPRGCCYRQKTPITQRKQNDGENDLPIPSWRKPNLSLPSEVVMGEAEKFGSKQPLPGVIDIKPDFPRSKFSVTSSDYPCSIRSSSSNSSSLVILDQVITPPWLYSSTPLLTPAEFFSLPSAPNAVSSSPSFSTQHSRTQSAPVFGHRRHPERHSTRRSNHPSQHRKSKTVSASVPIVESEWDIADMYGTLRSERARSVAVEEGPRASGNGETSRRNWI